MFTADADLATNRWEVVRIQAGHQTEIILLSSRFFELTTHWVGRTVLCPGEDCPLCDSLPSRGLFYAACKWNSRVSILELGSLSASLLEQNATLLWHGMHPGLVVQLARRNPKFPVKSECVRDVHVSAGVDHLVLARHVLALFKFPCPNVGELIDAYELRCRRIAKVRADRCAELAANAGKRK